jgi:nucleotide-binding universal stress UspA family protein
MLPLRAILVPVDFSEHSDSVFRLACSLARDHGARVYLLHVLATPAAVYAGGMVLAVPNDNKDQAWNSLRQFQAPDPSISVEPRLAEGDAADAILRVIADLHCDLVVMGTHGRTGLGRLLMGSVAEKVVRRAPCPVLTVKIPPAAAPASGQAADAGAAAGTVPGRGNP